SVVTDSGAPTAGLVYKLTSVDGHPVAKRSSHKASHGGAKRALRACRDTGTAVEEVVYPLEADTPDLGILHPVELTVPMVRDGRLVDDLPTLDESRDHLARQLVSLPWEGLALSRDEPALSVRFVDL
ncbi:MAG: nicotinate phosphoribosyltransferase, partial [Corynebacterium sp.]|nr:nicotinate phosphoribosyltransferase [Corynebacterium sp.]